MTSLLPTIPGLLLGQLTFQSPQVFQRSPNGKTCKYLFRCDCFQESVILYKCHVHYNLLQPKLNIQLTGRSQSAKTQPIVHAQPNALGIFMHAQ